MLAFMIYLFYISSINLSTDKIINMVKIDSAFKFSNFKKKLIVKKDSSNAQSCLHFNFTVFLIN